MKITAANETVFRSGQWPLAGLLALTLGAASPALGQAASSAPATRAADAWTFNFYLENDLFSETDQDYTNGIRLSWVSPNLQSYHDDPRMPRWLNYMGDQFNDLLGFPDGATRNVVFSLGQLMFTPQDKTARALVTDDRPYAGYLFAGFAYHARTAERLDSTAVDLGIVGPSAQGELAQDSVHDLRGFEKFDGWDNQLEDEPTLQVTYEQKRRLFTGALPLGLEHDFIAHAGASLGNVAVYANTGAEYRFGWDLPHDFGTSAIRPGGDNSAPGAGDVRLKRSDKWIRGLHVFVATDVRAVGRDIFLDGNTWKDSHSVDREPLVADLSVGFSFLVDRWKLSYAHVFRTREFEEQDDRHGFGSVTVSYSW